MTAVLSATYILNLCPTTAISDNRTPTEYLAGAQPVQIEGFRMQGVYMGAWSTEEEARQQESEGGDDRLCIQRLSSLG